MKFFQLLVVMLFTVTLSAQAVQLTFRVDMSEQNVSPTGVHVAGTFQVPAGYPNNWDPSTVQLFDADGDAIYEATVLVPPNTYLFKYVNADNWGGAELPTPDCSVFDGGGNYNRVVTVGSDGLILDPICFDECDVCGGTSNSGYVPDTDYNTFWWNDEVFYEVFVRSFYDSDGDGIGDFNGLTEKLDYLNDGDPNTDTDLGVTGLWLMPMMPSPSYHGYDVTDYRDVEPDYGTMEDFKTFLDAAHARGIKVIIDFVMNHSSSQHPWFLNARTGPNAAYRDWYRWSAFNPNQSGPWGQNVWHNYNSNYYFGIFWGGMPDLNYENEEVKAEIFDITNFWIDEVGVDGFRIDAVRYLVEDGGNMSSTPETFQVLEEFNTVYKAANPDALTVGEVWTSTPEVLQYVQDGDKMDLCFEFDLASGILNSINAGSPSTLDNQLRFINASYPPLQMATFLTNHDIDRVYGVLGTSISKMKLAATLYLTMPGVPFLYYGEEIGMLGSGPDENKRKPMQWDESANGGFTTGTPWYPLNSNYTSFNVEEFQADDNSLWNHYRRLIKWRHAYEPLRKGYYMPVDANNSNILAYARIWNDEAIITANNFTANSTGNISLSMAGTDLSAGTYFAYDLMSGTDLGTITIESDGSFSGFTPNVTLGTRESIIIRLSQEPTSIDQVESPAFAKVFPNPVKETLNIQLTSTNPVQLNIFDAVGQLVNTQNLNTGDHNLDWSAFANGVYFLHFIDGDKRMIQKVIKQ